MTRIAVLKGGRSLERSVSLNSAARVEDALERLGHDVVSIDVGGDLVPRLREARPDAAFVALHGSDGEDGTVQELLELLAIPYTGSGPAACARCWDKVLAKHVLREAGLPTPPFHAFTQTAFRDLGAAEALPEIERRLGFPIVVKPARGGSALGIKFARADADVAGALVAAFAYDTKVLLERHVSGSDLAVSVLDGEPLPVIEAVPAGEDFYDFEARYEIGRTTFVCPAELPDDATARAQELAVAAWNALGCRGFARVDLLRDRASGELTVLEANAVPGLTDTSLLPQAADAAGIAFDALVERILDLAVSRSTAR
ncbi:MAG: D-alanine-D-alanine ligase [Solirubrobacteraceae bacterium]|jgi:D-alanine-D-alanine ligase|nr:D-alanine-D-alanine ligase [Solirubrobacteraceae bacterium]